MYARTIFNVTRASWPAPVPRAESGCRFPRGAVVPLG